jgi:hypothetical protein
MSDTDDQGVSLNQVAEIVSAYVSNNNVPTNQIGDLITSVHQSLMNVDEKPPETLNPAVPIKQSVKPDHIVCLEDGKKLKMLKRHTICRQKIIARNGDCWTIIRWWHRNMLPSAVNLRRKLDWARDVAKVERRRRPDFGSKCSSRI